MRQAILVTAYRDMPQLERLIRYFDDDFEIFVHVDKKCREDYSGLKSFKNVHLFNQYKIAWGDVNHLKAILLLMREAFRHEGLEYFHCINDLSFRISFCAPTPESGMKEVSLYFGCKVPTFFSFMQANSHKTR